MDEVLTSLRKWVCRGVFSRGMSPLSSKAKIRINVDAVAFTLFKSESAPTINEGAPPNPDMTFTLPMGAFRLLIENESEDIAEVGIAILRSLIASDPKLRAHIQVHIGLFELIRLGYLSVLPLGGAPMIKFLAAHGLNGLGKIKEAIRKLRNDS